MRKELQVINFEEYAMEVASIKGQVQVIQHAMKEVMKSGEHYGTIPGCGDKPTLLKPGAEKICTIFRLSPTYEINRTDLQGGHREYEIICTLTHIPTGQVIAQGVGLCSSMESKYRWRKQERVCPECGNSTIIKGKTEFGGGWLCWAKKGGCGKKFKDGDQTVESQTEGRIENPDLADSFNTVLKIGKKRSHVDACLTATAASDIFTQDIEDIKPIDKPVEKKSREPVQQQKPVVNIPKENQLFEARPEAKKYIEDNSCKITTIEQWDYLEKDLTSRNTNPAEMDYYRSVRATWEQNDANQLMQNIK